MHTDCKSKFDVWVSLIGLVGALIAAAFGLSQWRRDQAWKRAEKTDALIAYFEADPKLQLAATAIDYTEREINKDGRTIVVINSTEVLSALQDARFDDSFSENQTALRDSFDALTSLFNRLELGLENDLIDPVAARGYFAYYLERFVSLDRHCDALAEDPRRLLRRNYMSTEFLVAYGDVGNVVKLARRWKVPVPYMLAAAEKDAAKPRTGVQGPESSCFAEPAVQQQQERTADAADCEQRDRAGRRRHRQRDIHRCRHAT